MVAKGGSLTIFDEPEAGIDLWSFNNLIRVFESMAAKVKGTTIIISHQERIINFANEVVLIEGGKIVQVGAPAKVMGGVKTLSRFCKVMEDKDVR